MLIGTYGYELRKPIAEALRIIQDYINSEVLTIECTVNEYSAWQSNLRIIDSYYYMITDGLPRHISEENTLFICDVIPRIYYNNLNPECVVTSNEFVYIKHLYSEFQITLVELDSQHEPTGVTHQVFSMSEAANELGNIEADCLMYVGSCAGVWTIPQGTFEGLTNLYDVRLPKSVRDVGEDAFAGTTWLERKRARQNNLVSVNDIFIDGKAASGAVELLSNIRIICNGAFHDNTNITSVKLPSSLVFIDNEAFAGCTGLEGISFPDRLETISTSAFEGSGLTSLYIPGNVKNIMGFAFSYCMFLEYVEICQGIELIQVGAFDNCERLEMVKIPNSVNRIYSPCFERELADIHQYIEIDKEEDSIEGAPWGAVNYTLTWR